MKTLPLAASFAATVTLLVAAPSHGYVRSTTETNVPVFWAGGCTFIYPDKAGTPDLSLDTVVATLKRSIANWQGQTLDAGCTYLRINQDPAADGEARLDYANVLKFRNDKWCRPAEKDRPEDCSYPASAAAITTVFYTNHPGQPDDGAIIDADIQMNNIHFTFVTVGNDGVIPVARPNTQAADLENTLTHELGHFQGLDHTCWDMAPPHQTTPPIDDTGKAIPSCNDLRGLPAAQFFKIAEATMYNYADMGEIKKRSITSDDIAGICGVYPAAKNPNNCERLKAPEAGGCTVGARRERDARSGQSQGAVALLFGGVALGSLGLAFSRRRRIR